MVPQMVVDADLQYCVHIFHNKSELGAADGLGHVAQLFLERMLHSCLLYRFAGVSSLFQACSKAAEQVGQGSVSASDFLSDRFSSDGDGRV
jgi:hypothetical protein